MKQLIPLDKRSKKAKREYHAKQRGSWNGVNPVTRIVQSSSAIIHQKLVFQILYDSIHHSGHGPLFSLLRQSHAGLQHGDLQLGPHLLLLGRDRKGAEIAVYLRFGHDRVLFLLIRHSFAVQHVINSKEHIPTDIWDDLRDAIIHSRSSCSLKKCSYLSL